MILLRRFLLSLAVILLVVANMTGNVATAYAEKAPKSLFLDPALTGATVISLYESTPDTQLQVVSSVLKSVKSLSKKAPGFMGLAILKSEDGLRAMAITQWKDKASYETSLIPPEDEEVSEKKNTKKAPPALKTLVADSFTVTAPPGIRPAFHDRSPNLIQFSDIVAKPTEEEAPVLEESLDFSTLPTAPKFSMVLKIEPQQETALLLDWGYSADEVIDITQFPVYNPIGEEESNLFENDQRLYEVVKIITPKLKSKEKESE